MSISNEIRRSVPPLPDPNEKDLKKLNRQMIDIIKYLIKEIRTTNAEQRLSIIESEIKTHTDQINNILYS